MFNFVHGFWFLIFTDGSKVTGDVANAGINRSPSAYLMNPQQERDRYATNVDKEMTVLKFVDGGSGKNIGAFSWFPTHGTSMSRDNKLISGDNKGAAARFSKIGLLLTIPQQPSPIIPQVIFLFIFFSVRV